MSVLDQIIPHSVEAEQSVIGSVILDDSSIDEISGLKPSHFYVGAHREIYQVMVDMSLRGKRIDVITLAEEISDRGLDGVTGGIAYLGEIAANTPSAANAKLYADLVQNKATERELLAVADSIRALVGSPGQTNDKLNKAQGLIMAISESRQRKQPRLLADGLADYVAALERIQAGESSGMSTGLASLDERLNGGLHDGQLIIVAGRPAMGKSAFTNTIALNVARNGNQAAIMSMEMSELDQYHRFVATLGRVSLAEVVDANLAGESGDRIVAAIAQMKDLPVIIDEEAGLSIHDVLSKARQIRRKHGLRLLIVDALGLMSFDQNRIVTELGLITKTLKNFAKEMGIPIILLCQLSRKCEDRTDKRPVLSDLRDSGNIEQDADVVLALYRDEYYNPDSRDAGIAEVLIRKNRQGKTGTVPLVFIGDQTRFEVLSGEWSPPDTSKHSFGRKKRILSHDD